MKYIHITPSAILSSILSISILCNTAAPALAQVNSTTPRRTNIPHFNLELERYTATTFANDAIQDQRVQQHIRMLEAAEQFSNGSLTDEQLARLAHIGFMFAPRLQGQGFDKTDFEQFQEIYNQQLMQEYEREKAALQDSRREIEQRITTNKNKYRADTYRKDLYTSALEQLTKSLSGNDLEQKEQFTAAAIELDQQLASLTLHDNQPASAQLNTLSDNPALAPKEKQLLTALIEKIQLQEQALTQWEEQANSQLNSWYNTNLAALDRWKASTHNKAQRVFDTEYSPRLLQAREQEVKSAVADLWAYKGRAPRARIKFLSLAPIIAQLRTMDGNSFLSEQHIRWLTEQYIQILETSSCLTKETANACNLEFTAISGLGMLAQSNKSDQAARAIETFMTASRKTSFAVPTLLAGTTALLSMKQYSVLRGFIYAATRDEQNVSDIDILSIENAVNMFANINGQYLGEISKYTQYPLQENPTDQTPIANAWEDVAQILADDGSPQALNILREYGVEQCSVYTEVSISLKEETKLRCKGIVPFLVGALVSGKSGANQYNPTSVETMPGYVATNYGNRYISPEQAQRNAAALANQKRAFFNYAASMGMDNAAMLARHLFLQSMGDLNAESELRVDTKLFTAYQNATANRAPKSEFAITAYTRNSAAYNAKRARQDRTQFFRKVGRWADIGILIWCVIDISKWGHSGVKIARAMAKASSMARNGATVAQRAVMLRNLNIAPKLRAFINIPGRIRNGMAPSVLAELPHFTSQTVELPKFAGFVESAGTIAAGSLRFTAETGTLAADVEALSGAAAGTLSPAQISGFDSMLGTASANANLRFANRSFWQRAFTFNANNSYRSYLLRELGELPLPSGFSAADMNTVRFQISNMGLKVPDNIRSFQVPTLLQSANGIPGLNSAALTRVMTTSLGTQPTAQQLTHTQGLVDAAINDANAQFLNRGWLSRQMNFLFHKQNNTYRNLLLDNLAAQFDKDGLMFTNPSEFKLYRDLVQNITVDTQLQAPTWGTQLGRLGHASQGGKFQTMGNTLFQTAGSSQAPQTLPLVFQMQRKRWLRGGISGIDTQNYQRVIITDKNGHLTFGFGNNLKEPVTPSQFKLTLAEEDVPTLLRAAQGYTGAPLQLKLTSTSGKWLWNPSFYSKRWTAFTQARQAGKTLPLGSLLRGKNNIYVHDIPVQIRLADGTLQTLPITFKADSYLGLRNASAVLDGGALTWYRDGQLLSGIPAFSYGLPKNQISPFLNLIRDTHLQNPLHLSGLSGKNKITPLMWATGLSLSSASTGLIAPLENVYGDRITEGEKTMISLAFPYLPSLAAPLFSPLVMKIGALRTLQIALGVSSAGLAFTTLTGFSGKLDNNNLPPIWPLYVSGTAIGISSALSRSGLNLLIDSMGGGGTLLRSMAYKNIGSFALLLPPFVANYLDKDIDFSLAFPVLAGLSTGALTWVSASRISSSIGKAEGFMPFKPLELSRPMSWLPTLGKNTKTAFKATWDQSWSTLRLLSTKEVLPLVIAATAFTGFEAGAFSKAGNQMIRPNLQNQDLPSWVPESNRKNYVAMLTNISVILFPLLARFTAKPTLKLMETGRAGDEYRHMLQASFALNTIGAGLLYTNGFDGYNSLGMLGIGLMGFGTANMTQSFQKLSNISVKSSAYARKLTRGLVGAEKTALENSLVTKTMTGFPVQQLGIAIVPTIVSAYTDRQIDEGVINKGDAAQTSMWIPITSLALCFGASASRIGLFPTHIPTGTLGLSKGIFGSYSGALQQLQIPQFYLKDPLYGVPPGFRPIPTNPIVNMGEIIPSQKDLKLIEKQLQANPVPAEEEPAQPEETNEEE